MQFILSLLFLPAAVHAADALKPYNIDKQNISISGVSSGAFMATQMEVAYSATFSGAGAVAGGIYWCAKGDSNRAQTVCMTGPEQVKPQEYADQARQWEAQGAIDPLANLSRHKVFVFASTKDLVIKPLHSDKLAEFYSLFGVIPVRAQSTVAAHGFPTLDQGNSCALGFLPWLLKCNYDGAGDILKTLHGNLQVRGAFDSNHLRKFDQAEFDKSGYFYPEGWVYIPEACERGEKCALHVALHGCQMNPDFIQDKFARLAGYNEWAETSNIIILYPQSKKISGSNPYACWDWYGFTGQDYALKSGAQMGALKAMIDRLASPR